MYGRMEGGITIRAIQFPFFVNKTIIISLLLIILLIFAGVVDGRGGGGGGGHRSAKSKGKSNLQFAQVAEFSLVHSQLTDHAVSFFF